MNKAYWNDLADRFDASVFDIAANETSGNLGERIRTLGENHQTAGDFGCGAGATTALLSNHFDRVVAVDFAEKLLAAARKRMSGDNVDFIQSDLSKKAELPFKGGASFCFNALIHPADKKRRRIAQSVFRNTETGGSALFVVPALESYLRIYQTVIECRVQQGTKRSTATRSVAKTAGKEIRSLAEGICDVGGVATKHFMQDEIGQLVSGVGFDVTSVERVEFSWSEELDHFPESLGPPYPWDWMVTADKP